MKTYPSFVARVVNPTVALAIAAALLPSTLGPGVSAQQMASQKSRATAMTQNQRIIHVLNRLGFGARPGDVERVRVMGLENYINQQLNPGSISDTVVEAKLQDKNLPTLAMTTSELYEKYPQPGQLLRQLERRGDLPGDLASARDNRVKGANKTGEMAPPEKNSAEKPAMPGTPANPNPADLNPQNNEAYRKQ